MASYTESFAQWLTREMELKGFGDNQSKLAAYLGTGASTVNAWLTRGAVPQPPLVRKLADVLKVPVEEVMARAGHLAPVESPEVPGVIPELLSLLRTMTEPEQRRYALRAVQLAIEIRDDQPGRARYPERDPHPPALGEAAEDPGPRYGAKHT